MEGCHNDEINAAFMILVAALEQDQSLFLKVDKVCENLKASFNSLDKSDESFLENELNNEDILHFYKTIQNFEIDEKSSKILTSQKVIMLALNKAIWFLKLQITENLVLKFEELNRNIYLSPFTISYLLSQSENNEEVNQKLKLLLSSNVILVKDRLKIHQLIFKTNFSILEKPIKIEEFDGDENIDMCEKSAFDGFSRDEISINKKLDIIPNSTIKRSKVHNSFGIWNWEIGNLVDPEFHSLLHDKKHVEALVSSISSNENYFDFEVLASENYTLLGFQNKFRKYFWVPNSLAVESFTEKSLIEIAIGITPITDEGLMDFINKHSNRDKNISIVFSSFFPLEVYKLVTEYENIIVLNNMLTIEIDK